MFSFLSPEFVSQGEDLRFKDSAFGSGEFPLRSVAGFFRGARLSFVALHLLFVLNES